MTPIRFSLATLALALFAAPGSAADPSPFPHHGRPPLKSAGALAFGPERVLFVGDSQSAAVFALKLPAADKSAPPIRGLTLDGVDARIAARLGTTPDDIQIHDLAVEPVARHAWLSVSRGKGAEARPAIIQVDGAGQVSDLPLDDLDYAVTTISNVPGVDEVDRRGASLRQESITDLAFLEGRLYVAGLSNEEFASKFRIIPFPFGQTGPGASVEIYHGAHGQLETRSPVRTFTPVTIDNKPHLVAAYTCTPLVKFPIADLESGAKIRGTTVAELGNRNRPLDVIAYRRDGRNSLLLANSARGVIRVSADAIDTQQPITSKIEGTAGLDHETIPGLVGVEQLDKLDDNLALILVHTEAGPFRLESIPLP